MTQPSPNQTFENIDRQPYKDIPDIDDASRLTYDAWQIKYDGIWGRFEFKNNCYWIYSRDNKLKEHGRVEQEVMFPTEFTLIGEFLISSQWAQDPKWKGKLFAFDCIKFESFDLRKKSYLDRYHKAKEIVESLAWDKIHITKNFRRCDLEGFWSKIRDDHSYEGVVFRKFSDDYSDTVHRLKLELEDEFVITSWKPGDPSGRHHSRMGSVLIAQWNEKTSQWVDCGWVGGGFSDIDRDDCADNFHRWNNKVITVRGKKRFTSGKFRHPNFVMFRDDKSPKQCLFQQ